MARRARKPAIVVRPLEPTDAPAMHAMMLGEEVFPTTGAVPSLSLAAVSEKQARFAADDNRHSFAALVSGELVGIGGLIVFPRPRMRHAASLFLEVHQDHHGQGVGTALMTKVLDLADRWLGLVRVELQVNATNARAVRLYERFGFEKEGVLRANYLSDGAYVDSLMMARLRPPPRMR